MLERCRRAVMRWLLAIALLFSAITACLCELRIQSVDRQINLQSQFAKVTQSIKIKNTGTSPVTSFDVCALASLAGREAFLKVTEGKSKKPLTVGSSKSPSPGVECHTISFSAPLAVGESQSVDASAVYTKVQTPKPAEIKQDEKQFMVYTDNLHVVSPYHVSQQNTEVLLPSSQVLGYTKNKASLSGTTLKFGRFDSVKPFSLEELRVHYESSKTFVEVLKLEKEVQVSHWGNIYVEETYELKNAGASHIGSFSRLKYSQQFQRAGNSFRELVARLPHNAHSLYYKDLIGNISTSNVRKTPTSTLLNFELRYPLLGGWKVDFFVGWSIPLDKSLFQLGRGKLQLRSNFGSCIDGVHVDELVMKVVLPEGSNYLSDNLPFEVARNFSTKFTYLDTSGRPVLVYHKLNVVPEHNVQFEIDYSFNSLSLLREPLLLISAFAAFFATVVVINRLDLTISRDDAWKDSKTKEQTSTSMANLSRLFDEIDIAAEKLGKLALATNTTSAAEGALSEKSSIEARLRAIQSQIDAELSGLKAINSKLAGQVEEEVDRKAAAFKERAGAQLTSKVDLLKKGASAADIQKKMADFTAHVQQLEREFKTAHDRLFGQY